MICKECGEKIEGITRICPHCGGRALVDDEIETWGFIADTGEKHQQAMPKMVELNAPSAVPEGCAAQLEGLYRLKDYFMKYSNLYQVVEDLHSMEQGRERPSFVFWLMGGGAVAALFYIPLIPFLPHFLWAYYFVLWGAVTVGGYLRAGRCYERERAEHALLLRHAENDLRAMYNRCKDCFLPLAWTPPPRIEAMMRALRAGRVHSVQDYMMREEA